MGVISRNTYLLEWSCSWSAGGSAVPHEPMDPPCCQSVSETASSQTVARLAFRAKRQRYLPYEHMQTYIIQLHYLLSEHSELLISARASVTKCFHFLLCELYFFLRLMTGWFGCVLVLPGSLASIYPFDVLNALFAREFLWHKLLLMLVLSDISVELTGVAGWLFQLLVAWAELLELLLHLTHLILWYPHWHNVLHHWLLGHPLHLDVATADLRRGVLLSCHLVLD